MQQLARVIKLIKRIELSILGIDFIIRVEHDKKKVTNTPEPRVYIQLVYSAPDSHLGGESHLWKGGKWYLSEHMSDDEIVKKIYLAFRTAVEHEVLEGFKVDNVAIFNPHRDFEDLIALGDKPEVKRKPQVDEVETWDA